MLPAFDRVHPLDSISQIGSKVREGRVHPSQTSSVTGRSRVLSCTRSSKAGSVLSERVELAAEKAAMVAKVFFFFFFFFNWKKGDHSNTKDFVRNTKKSFLK